MVALPANVFRVKAKGREYYYFQSGRGTETAGKRVRLPNDPQSVSFWQAYEELAGQDQSVEPQPEAGTIDALIQAYRTSPEYECRKPRTKEEYSRHMRTLSEILGPLNVRTIRPKHVLQLRDSFADTPTKADHIVAMLSTLIGWGVPRDYADSNPCRDIGDLASSDGYPPWEWEDVTFAKENLPPHLWWAAALALFTGQRQSDCLAMDWKCISGGEVSVRQAEISMRQAKTGKALWIPLHNELRPILNEIPRNSTRILTNSRGRPWASGFKAAWQGAMNRKEFSGFRERRLTFHGLRKSAVCMLLESGCTDGEVAAITGQSRDMIQHYSVMVNQRRLARSAILRWENARRG